MSDLVAHIPLFIQHSPGHTAAQISQALFGLAGYHERVGNTLRMLSDLGNVERRGGGGPGDPFRYHPIQKEPPAI
jgi:hypothetical protein